MNRRRVLIAVGGAVALAAAVLGAVALAGGSDDGDDEREPARPEILLEPADSVGPEPFTTVAVTDATTTTALTGETSPAGVDDEEQVEVCDPTALTAFLGSSPEIAEAWVGVFNDDPEFDWSGAIPLEITDIPDYIAELRSVLLIGDAWVTNHGYRSGRAVSRQAVLQTGTAVLVDADDRPRVRCKSGNPLIGPEDLDDPRYVGERWPGFDPDDFCEAGLPCVPPATVAESTTTTDCPPDCPTTRVTTRPATTRPPTTRPATTTTRRAVTTTTTLPTTTVVTTPTTTSTTAGSSVEA